MNLFAFGSNGSGQLGIGHKEDVSTPTKCLFTSPSEFESEPEPDSTEIIKIVAGGNHTLLLTKNGSIYAAGYNSDGRCGPPTRPEENQKNILSFKRIILDINGSPIQKFKCLSATWEESILVASITEQGRTYDKVFILGSSDLDGVSVIPDFPVGTEVSALASSMGHTVAILSNGDVYGWGAARKGQLGEQYKGMKNVSLVKIEVPFPAKEAVCGREFTVILGEKEKSEMIILGDRGNRWGVMDVDSGVLRERIREQAQTLCAKDQGENVDSAMWGVEDLAASWHGIYVVASTEADKRFLIAWGRNDRGQLPRADIPLEKLAVGSEHGIALLRDGSVAAFGWGEHGNCGPETDPHGNVAGLHKLIPLDNVDGRVIGVGAGCATSWLIVG